MAGNEVQFEPVAARVREHHWGPAAYAVRGETPFVTARFTRALGVFQARMGETPEPARDGSGNGGNAR
jgi:hypothetical protein